MICSLPLLSHFLLVFSFDTTEIKKPHINTLHPEFHPPKLALKHVSTLLYADDVAIMMTPIGMRRALAVLDSFCRAEKLKVNLDKTKNIVFSKGRNFTNGSSLFLKYRHSNISG